MKYIGLVKTVYEGMSGYSVKLIANFSDDKIKLEEWIQKYPGCESIILEPKDDKVVQFFKAFYDMSTKSMSEEELAIAEEFFKNFFNELGDI